MLRGIKPEIVRPDKPKFMISGKSGVGKTMFALDFPAPYLIDTEGGAMRKQYIEKIKKSDGMYFGKEQGSQDFSIVIDEIKQLATVKHGYKTLIIDSFTKLYDTAAAVAEASLGSDFGKDKKEANKPTRQFIRWIEKLDMTVILVCHLKDKWERKGNNDITYVGTTFSGYEKLEYELDLWLECVKVGKERDFIIKKSRIASFVEGDEYPLDYKKFSSLYGQEAMESPVQTLVMATKEEVSEINHLIDVVRLDDEIVTKWLKKAEAENFSEMSSEQIQKCIGFIKNKIKNLDSGKENPKKSVTKKEAVA